MKSALFALGMAMLLLSPFLGCEKQNDGPTGPGGTPGEPSDVPDDIALARSFPPLLANGVDEITVYATVVDAAGRGLDGVGVVFVTTHGAIEPYATTSGTGVAQTTLTSTASTEDVIAAVTAQASTATGETMAAAAGARILVTQTPLKSSVLQEPANQALLRPRTQGVFSLAATVIEDIAQITMKGITITAEAHPAVIPADGVSECEIVAMVTETTRGVPLSDESLSFGTSAGSIEGQMITGSDGVVAATLRASPGETAATVTVYYGQTLTATTAVAFSPLTLSLATDMPPLLADGASETNVVALLVNDEGNPIVGARVDFGTTLGTVTSPVDTDADGRATARLIAGTAPGTATVRASFGDLLRDSVTVMIAALPTAASLELGADPAILSADGLSQATIIATALDADGNLVPNGTAVTFSVLSGGGTIVQPVRLTSGGVAEATYIAGTTAGTVSVQASSGSATETTSLELVHLDVGRLTLTTESPTLLANGIESTLLTATVTDVHGHPVLPGTIVSFAAGEGEIDRVSPTDENGVATAWLRSDPLVTGTARVSARAGEFQRTVDVKFVSEEAAHIEEISTDPPSIGVVGAGDHETAVMIFEVQDCNGIPVDLDHAVTLDLHIEPVTGETDAYLCPLSATTNDRGLATTTVNAQTKSGVVKVSASVGTLLGEPIKVAIHGDQPDVEHFGIAFEQINIAGLVHAGIHNPVTGYVGDAWGNPVPLGTRVWFYSEYGLVQGSAGTNEHGEATVDEVTAAPFPQIPGGDGLVTVCAQTVDKSGAWIETCGDVMWSGSTIVEILEPEAGFDVPNGGAVTIQFQVRDANFNPLTEGTSISVAATEGKLAGVTSFTLPDTQSSAYTEFEVILTDDDALDVDPRTSIVTITVTSFNGDVVTTISGTVN